MSDEDISVQKLAGRLGMSVEEFERKISSGQFGLLDAEAAIQVLNLKNPESIFFPEK